MNNVQLLRDSEPVRLLETPRSLNEYILTINVLAGMNYLLTSRCLHCKSSPHALPLKMEKKLKTVFYLDIKVIILFRHRGARYLVIQHSPGTTHINHWSVTYRTSISPGNPRIMSINSIWDSLLLSSWTIIIFQFGSLKGSCCFWLLSLTLCFCVNFLSSCSYLGL